MPYASHSFHELFIHVNWHCYADLPMLDPELERACHDFIREYCDKTRGVQLHGIGGTATHVHMALQVEPFVAPADLIGKLKGASAHAMNRELGARKFQWQRGYGVVSFSRKHVKAVLDYIDRQKEHHASGKGLNPILEDSGVEMERSDLDAEAVEKPR